MPTQLDTACLEAFFTGVRGRTEVRLVVDTEPELLDRSAGGAPRPEWMRGVVKTCVLRCLLGVPYADYVNERRVIEGRTPDFVPSARKGPPRIGDTPLRQGKEGLLLEAIVLECESTAFRIERGDLPFLELARDEVEPWLKPRYDAGAHQGLERPVVYRTFRLSSILAVETRAPV